MDGDTLADLKMTLDEITGGPATGGHSDQSEFITNAGDATNSTLELALAAGKGMGLFATKDIKRGTRIISESPLIAMPPGKDNLLDVRKELEKLTPDQLNRLSELHHENGTIAPKVRAAIRHRLSAAKQYRGRALDLAVDDEVKMLAIFNTNAVQMGASAQWGTGVFPLYSRINHSCIPNVHNSYNATIGKEIVHAVRDIAQGEEILTSYIVNLRTHEQRSQKLMQYGFECECEACKGPKSAEHEAYRQRLFEIDQGFALLSSGSELLAALMVQRLPKDDVQALAWADEMVTLLKKEGLVGMDLAMAYRECARQSLKLGRVENAIAYAHEELEVERYCIGDETAHLEHDMESAEFWIKHIKVMAEKDQVKLRMNEKRTKKEEKKAEKKAAKKAAKKGRWV